MNNVLEPFNYYYLDKKYKNFEDFINNHDNLEIDLSSLYSLLTKGYILGNNTLIKNLKRDSWSKNVSLNLVNYNEIYKSKKTIAEDLISLLQEELLENIQGKSHLYILLSGGMDSRILAALLRDLEKRGQTVNKKISAITWGMKNSRDVEYSKRISEKYRWGWIHLPLSHNTLKDNIAHVIDKVGLEVNPIHLHHYYKAGKIAKGEESLILAASYGDSLGRGEYSGIKVKDLDYINLSDRFGIFEHFNERILNQKNKSILQDFREKNSIYHQDTIEIEYQNHYLHKMLYNSSRLVNYNSQIFQLFSTKKVMEYILALKFECRNDEVYHEILKQMAPELLELSWARTGKLYLEEHVKEDNLKKNHHEYSAWIKRYFSEEIFESINSSTIREMEVFDIAQLNRLYKIWKYEREEPLSNLTNIFFTILCLKRFIEKYEISCSPRIKVMNQKLNYKKLKGILTEIMIVVRGYMS